MADSYVRRRHAAARDVNRTGGTLQWVCAAAQCTRSAEGVANEDLHATREGGHLRGRACVVDAHGAHGLLRRDAHRHVPVDSCAGDTKRGAVAIDAVRLAEVRGRAARVHRAHPGAAQHALSELAKRPRGGQRRRRRERADVAGVDAEGNAVCGAVTIRRVARERSHHHLGSARALSVHETVVLAQDLLEGSATRHIGAIERRR